VSQPAGFELETADGEVHRSHEYALVSIPGAAVQDPDVELALLVPLTTKVPEITGAMSFCGDIVVALRVVVLFRVVPTELVATAKTSM